MSFKLWVKFTNF